MTNGAVIHCKHCDEPFTWFHGKPGKINECPACAKDVERLMASIGDEDGLGWEPIPESKRRQIMEAARQWAK